MLHERFRALGSIWLVRDEGWAGSGRGQDSILWGPMAGFRRQEMRLLVVALAATPQTKYLKASVEPGDSLWDRVVSWFLRRCPNAAVSASWSTFYWWTKAVILKCSHQIKECELARFWASYKEVSFRTRGSGSNSKSKGDFYLPPSCSPGPCSYADFLAPCERRADATSNLKFSL